MGKMKKELDSVLEKVRELELHRASDATVQKTILEAITSFATMFEKHDEKEMAKYDKYDEHLQSLNSSITDLSNKLNNIASGQEDYRVSLRSITKQVNDFKVDLETDIKKLDDKTDIRINKLFSYANRALGAITFSVILIGAVWSVANWYDNKMKAEIEEKAEMERRLQKYESNQIRNYDREQIIREYNLHRLSNKAQDGSIR